MSADFSDSAKAELRLRNAANRLHGMTAAVAKARTIKEFSGDRKKNTLARYMASKLIGGSGVAAAEMLARATPEYQAEQETLEAQYRDACAVIAEWDATFATFEAARSLVSMSKQLMRNIPE